MSRRSSYKPAFVDASRGRRRRDDGLALLRKLRRDGDLLERRRRLESSVSPAAADGADLASSPSSMPPTVAGSELEDIYGKIWTDDITLQLDAAVRFRKLISDEKYHMMKDVTVASIIPRLVEFLSREELPNLQFEAAWTITNVACGTSEDVLLLTENGAIPKLIKLLNSPCLNVREQAVWALGNIAADSPSCRELIFDSGGLGLLLSQFHENAKISMLRTATWALSNICYGKMLPEIQVRPVIDVILLLINSIDERILASACWTLYYLLDGSSDGVLSIIWTGVSQLVKLLLHWSPKVVFPAISIIGKLSAGSDAEVQMLVDNCVVPCLFQILTKNYQKVIKGKACLVVSNITAGGRSQIQAVIDAGIIVPVKYLLLHGEADVRREAAWAISNAASGASRQQIQYLANQGCIQHLCACLIFPDADILCAVLNGLDNILRVGALEKKSEKEGLNPYAELVVECGGLEKLENLQDFGNDAVYRMTIKILETYWDEDDDGAEQVSLGRGHPPAPASVTHECDE